jgi:hypothetical protein
MPDNRKIFLFAAVCIILLRWVFPEADPPWFKDLADFHDETWWAENARRKILFNTWFWDQYAGALAAGPLSVLWHYVVFKLFGISFFSLRLIALIPATLSGLILLKSSVFSSEKNPWILLLVLSSAGWFAYSRIGYVESMLLFIFLSSLVLLKRGDKPGSVAGVLLLCAGMFFKGSFVYLALPLIVWSGFQSTVSAKHNWFRLLGFLVLSGVGWIIYFYPQQELFLPYYKEIKSQYYSTLQLLHPGGWITRLVWLTSKETFSAPFTGWILILLLIKWVKNGIPLLKNSISLLLLLCLFFALPSDFADRRLVFLYILPAFCLGEADLKKKNSFLSSFLLNFTMILPLLQRFTEPTLQPDDLLTYYLLPCGVLAGLLFIAMKLEFRFAGSMPVSPISLAALSITAHSILFHSSARWADTLQISFNLLYSIQLVIFISLITGLIIKAFLNESYIIAGITVLQLGVCVHLICNTTFTVRNSALYLANKVTISGLIPANPPALELLFLSRATNSMYRTEHVTRESLTGVFLYDSNYRLSSNDSLNFYNSGTAQLHGIVPSRNGYRLKYIFASP